MMLNDFASKRITVMGVGRFGGGIGVTRWLANQNAHITLTDFLPKESLSDSLDEISALIRNGTVQLTLGEHVTDDFTRADLVIANPAVPKPWENKYLLAAQKHSVSVTTEIRLLTERLNRNRVIGITGTVGKSTTAAMIHHALTKLGVPSHFGGNIGGSLLESLTSIKKNDWIVLELSSAMLHWLGNGVGYADAPGWSPHVAVMTNLSPNHLDWHGSIERYKNSKHNIFKFQIANDVAIAHDSVVKIPDHIPLLIPGQHNQMNAQYALAVVSQILDTPLAELTETLNDFAGLPHRLQLIAEEEGMRFFDDSKSTTPESTVLAINAFEDVSRVHLIAGGYDKGVDLKSITDLAPQLAGLYTIGATGTQIAHAAGPDAHAEFCETLDTAVSHALNRMKPGDILLLSPGCASWDQFTNYEHRGKEFARLVRNHIGSTEIKVVSTHPSHSQAF